MFLYLQHLTKPFDDESKCTDYGLKNQMISNDDESGVFACELH